MNIMLSIQKRKDLLVEYLLHFSLLVLHLFYQVDQFH